ncbi:MAG: hypothetical protein ABI224_02545 [Acetobacteraceae bacterium]
MAEQVGQLVVGNFFAWGAGGAGNIRSLCRVLQALDFEKAAALLNGAKELELKRLASEFPAYFFGAISDLDIRTKPERKTNSARSGLLDKKPCDSP